MSKKFLLFFIVLANFLQLYSQEFISKTYTSQDNLPDNYIYSLERYENGYLWAGTSSGLSKYNGNKFETIISKDSLENIFVTAQYFSKNHGHWLGLYDGTISKVINDTIYTVLIPEGSFGKICGIAEDSSQNTMYFLSTYGSIYAINEKDTQEFQLNIESLSKMLQFENNIYILSDRGIFLYRGKNLVQQYAFGKINDFQIDKQEKAIVEVSDEGLSLRSLTGDILSKFRKANGLLSNRCSKVYVDKNNIYILHYALGISIINKKSKKISVIDFSREKGIPELNYSSFMVDKEGIFWLGSYGNGIVKFEYSLFNTIETGFKEPITAITKDSLGNIWVSTERKVYYNSEYTFLNTPFKEILTIEGNITSLCKAYNNELWIGTKYQGVYIYNFVDDTKKTLNKDNWFFSNKITDIQKTYDGFITVSSLDNGIYRIPYNGDSLHFNTLNGLIHNYISSTFLDSEGQQWLSTKRTSISFYDTKNEFFKTLKPDSINFGLNINGICEDYIGNIWFATNGNALLKFSNNEFRWIGNRNNTLSSQYCYSIKNDKFDNIWVSHRNGFSVYIPNDNRTIAFKSNQGFPEGSSINNSIIKLSNKNLLAVSGQNLVKINTALVNDNHSTPYVNIDKLLINGKEYYSQNEINLKYGNYTIDFSFVGLSFKKGSPLLFSYKLDGIDTKWSELTAHHQIKYLVNDYGTYVFRIKGINAYKQESDIKSYKIVIKKPFYLHYWFLILSSIAIIGTPALYTYIRFRNSIRSRQQLEQKVKERTLEILQKSREIEEQKEELAISKAQSDELLRQFEDTLENLEDVYFKTDRTFNYKQVSPSILKHLNIDSLDKVIGRPLIEHWEFWPGEDKKLFKKIIKNKSIKGLLIKYKATGGSLKYGKINARAIFKDGKFEAIEGYVRDVTSDIEYNKQIVDLNIQQELLINNIPSAIYYKDTDLKYIQVNNYFANLIGKEVVDIIGYSDSDLVDSKTREEFEELNKQVIETKKPLYNYIRETRSNEGDMLWISTTMVPIIGQENKAEGVIGVIQDITERIEYENKLKESKETLEQIHNDLSDNINYAKSIQEALFTSDNIIDSFLNDYFIMFQPRDNVSGDFYYVNKFEDSIIIAAADCTGHGVSGAFLTVLGITFLHDIVSRNDINDPGSVLDQLREKVKETYKTFGSNRNDGLDIALCVLNTKTKELSYSGAYNPLWIVRENKLIEYKATRNPIGVYVNEKEFEVHNIQLIEGDSFYIFSDGYADQFGGENGKKFKYDPLKKLIIKNSSLPMKKQKDRLVENFNQWKGKNDQVDDVTFIGVKV